jgi:hypothetical protein
MREQYSAISSSASHEAVDVEWLYCLIFRPPAAKLSMSFWDPQVAASPGGCPQRGFLDALRFLALSLDSPRFRLQPGCLPRRYTTAGKMAGPGGFRTLLESRILFGVAKEIPHRSVVLDPVSLGHGNRACRSCDFRRGCEPVPRLRAKDRDVGAPRAVSPVAIRA